jgi:SagB-type dehydrogenase family enzyme
VCYAVSSNGNEVATLEIISPSFVARPGGPVAGGRYVLCRFAHLRRRWSEMVLESPLAHARIVLRDCRAAAVVAGLAGPTTLEGLGGLAVGLPTDAVAGLLTLLIRAGIVREVSGDAGESDALKTWEFHDLLFHARSRLGRSDSPAGGTFRLVGELPPPPALRQDPTGEVRELYRPELARLERDDPPLTTVLEHRASCRDFAARQPITDRQLGEFLFRVARVKERWQTEVATRAGPVRLDFASRPYPAGGSLYELELYPVVNRCEGVAAGFYYYDPSRHGLTRPRGRGEGWLGLLEDAATSIGAAAEDLQVLLILAARHPRVAWKYESIAYSLTLKHVGVLFQTMYLVATAMGLGACAVGCGDSDRFGQAAGADYCAETSVGEFLLGSR